MREYLAKPEETVERHTEKLLEFFKNFMLLYGENFTETEKEQICFCCTYHDKGKMNPHFQQKIREKKWNIKGEFPHGVLSCAFIDRKRLKEQFGIDYKIIYQAIYNHHTRDFNFGDSEINEYIERTLKPYLLQDFPDLALDVKSHSLGKIGSETDNLDEYLVKYFRIKGMLNKFDYAASALTEENTYADADGTEYPPRNPFNYIRGYINEHFKSDLNSCQQYMAENKDKNLLVIASTGSGKTEGSLLWAGGNKTFYTLPLKVSIDAIYKRLYENGYYEREKLGHLHSDTISFFTRGESGEEKKDSVFDKAFLYQRRAKAFVYPMTVCTVDQLFLFVFKAAGFEILPATLSYSKLIIDEIQSYSPNIIACILYGLKLLTKMGGKFCIMTATLPPFLTYLMEQEKIPAEKPKFFHMDKNRHKIKLLFQNDFDYEKIRQSAKDKKVLVICNTVKRAQQVYETLKDFDVIHLLHSRFTKTDRAIKEDIFKKAGKKDSVERGIFISTQIVEASLDIDFDELHTDMCTADSLLQRLGRCYRAREYDGAQANVYIADSKIGVGKNSVYDPDIYKFSVDGLKEYDNQIFSEKSKQDYMDSVYSYEKIKDTAYFSSLIKTIDILKKLPVGAFNKNEAQREFRDILTKLVIPYCFYNEVEDIIKPMLSSADKRTKYEGYELLKDRCISISYQSYERLKREGADFYPILDTDFYQSNLIYDNKMGLLNKFDDEVENVL